MDLLWQLDFSFGEDLCSPKYHPTTRPHCFTCNLCNCPALSLTGAGGGEGSAFPALHHPLSLGLGARGHSSTSQHGPLQLPARTSLRSGQLWYIPSNKDQFHVPAALPVTFLTKSAFLGQVGAGSPVSGWTGFVCALGEAEGLAAAMGGAQFVAWERGDVLGLAAHHSPSPVFQLKVLNFGNVFLRKKRGVKRCQRGARSGKGEQQEQVVVSRGCLSTECWSRLSSLGTQGTPSHPPWALE